MDPCEESQRPSVICTGAADPVNSSVYIQKTQQTSEYSYRPAYVMPITHADFGIRSYTLTRKVSHGHRTQQVNLSY